jgi:O-antigen/teichoic acid export membrane protein
MPGFSMRTIARTGRFSMQMTTLTILSLVYTQIGHIMTSGLLPIAALGYYNGAYSLSSRGIASLQTFFNSAILPALSEDFGHDQLDNMRSRYSKYTQLLLYFSTLPAFIFIFFGYEILVIWTTLEVAEAAYSALIMLSIAFLLNTAASTGFILCVATENMRIPIWLAIVPLPFYIPLVYVLVKNFDIEGVALALLLRNITNLGIIIALSRNGIIVESVVGWFSKYFIPYICVGLIVFLLGRGILLVSNLDSLLFTGIIGAFCALFYTLFGFLFLDTLIKQEVIRMLWSGINTTKSQILRKRH